MTIGRTPPAQQNYSMVEVERISALQSQKQERPGPRGGGSGLVSRHYRETCREVPAFCTSCCCGRRAMSYVLGFIDPALCSGGAMFYSCGTLIQRQGHNDIGDEGWVTTSQAARILHVIPRQVRNYIAAGDLEGRKEVKGVNER